MNEQIPGFFRIDYVDQEKLKEAISTAKEAKQDLLVINAKLMRLEAQMTLIQENMRALGVSTQYILNSLITEDRQEAAKRFVKFKVRKPKKRKRK